MVKNDYYEGTRDLEDFDMLQELNKEKEYDVRIGDNEEVIVTLINFKKGKGKKTWRHTKYVLCQCYAHYKIKVKNEKTLMEKIPYTINQLLQLSKSYAAPQVYAFLVTNKLIKEPEVNISIKKISNTYYFVRLLTKEETDSISESLTLHRHCISEQSITESLHSIAYHISDLDTNIAPNKAPIKDQLRTNKAPIINDDYVDEKINEEYIN